MKRNRSAQSVIGHHLQRGIVDGNRKLSGNFGAATTIATCTVPTGNVSGVSTGTFSLTAGDVYDVQVANGNVAGGVTAALGP